MNWDVIGHEWAVSLLSENLKRDRLRHAYLFTGPPGVGRRTLALRLAAAINCLNPPAPGQPCLECRACRMLEKMEHPDLSVVQAEKEGGTLKVDQVRELQHRLSLAPYEARYRIALLLRFEEAHPSAANALLKTLEEPAPRVVLLLTASSPEDLLPTIVSRCETLRLRPLALEQAVHGLRQRWSLPPEQAQLLAHVSGGRLGHAYQLHHAPERLEQRRMWLDEHTRLLSESRLGRFNYVEALVKDKDLTRLVLQTWLSLWRDVLLRASGASAAITNFDRAAEVDEFAQRFGLETSRQALTSIERTLEQLDRNVNARLACEVLMLDLPRR
jgi:DNA polymerase III subunit delta'